MYDLIYNFINDSLINTTAEVYNLPQILTIVSIVLIYMFLVKVLIWSVTSISGCTKW